MEVGFAGRDELRLIRACLGQFGGARLFCPEGATGLSLGFQPQEYIRKSIRPERAEDVLWSTVCLITLQT